MCYRPAMGKISSSLEDYLEAILVIADKKGAARPKDIAGRLQVTPASVTGALKQLADKDLVNYAPYDVVTLTDAGKRTARAVARRHQALLDFFTTVLGIPPDEAEASACRIEHVISDHVLERLTAFAEFVRRCPNSGATWQEKTHGYFCKDQCSSKTDCEKCNLED